LWNCGTSDRPRLPGSDLFLRHSTRG